MNVALFTSDEQRHRFFVNYLAERLPVSLAVMEPKTLRPDEAGKTPDETRMVKAYFADRACTEEQFFPDAGRIKAPSRTRVLTIARGPLTAQKCLKP